jgi:hypothetical protein
MVELHGTNDDRREAQMGIQGALPQDGGSRKQIHAVRDEDSWKGDVIVRQRALVHVAGPRGAGKTTFIEAMLEAEAAFATCVRGERDPKLRGECESTSKSQREIRRYLDAGASAATLYRFSQPDTIAFFTSTVMQEYSEAVFIEGDCPVDCVELSVFIAPPLAPGEAVLRQVKVDHKAEHQAQLAAFKRAGDSPDAASEWLRAQVGLPLGDMIVKYPSVLNQLAAGMRASRAHARQTRPPAPTACWVLADGYEGIERAQLVVVNQRGEKERECTKALLAEVVRLRKDRHVFEDILGYRGSKIPITAVIADLSNAKDAGLKKALARVKRSLARS